MNEPVYEGIINQRINEITKERNNANKAKQRKENQPQKYYGEFQEMSTYFD